MFRWGMAACILAVTAASGTAAATPPVLAVFDVEDRGAGLDRSQRERLSIQLTGKLAASGAFKLVPRGQLRRRLAQQKISSYKQCYDRACQIEIGRELAAQKSLATTINRLGSHCTLLAVLYDLKTAASEGGATARGGCSEEDLAASLEQVVDQLAPASARVPITVEPATPQRPPRVKVYHDPGTRGVVAGSGKKPHPPASATAEPPPTHEPAGQSSDDGPRPPWETIVSGGLGLTLVDRSFDFTDPVTPPTPSNYRSGLAYAVLFEAEFYPLAMFLRGLATGLGITVRYYRVLGLKSQMVGSGILETTLDDLQLGLTFRWNILGSAGGPRVGVGLGYGRQSFTIHDEATNPAPLPDVQYDYLKLGLLKFRVPVYTSQDLALGAFGNFDYLVVASAGDIESSAAGGYGDASVYGYELQAGLFLSLSGFFVRASYFHRRISLEFDNACSPTTGCYAAGGAEEVYHGAHILLGYAF